MNFSENFLPGWHYEIKAMRFLPWWRGRRTSDPAGNRLGRFRKVLEAAQCVAVYQPSLTAARLDTKKALRRITDIRSVLARIGVYTLEQVRVRPRRQIGTPVFFKSPLSLGATPNLYWNSAGCAVLQTDTRGYRALFIRTGVDEGLLSSMERDGLWHRHGAPMFEHLVGMDGELLAWECETHCGLHIVEENAVFEIIEGELLLTSLTDLVQPTIQMRTGWTARIDTEMCDCGRPGPRLMGIHEVSWNGRVRQKLESRAAAAHA